MPGLFLVNTLDVARVLGPDPKRITVDGVFQRLEELYLRPRGGGFNHDPAIRATLDLFRGALTPIQARQYCLTNGNPKGREQNAAIVGVVSDHAASNVSRCHQIGYVAVRIARYRGKAIHIGIKAPFVRVREQKEAFLVVPGFRKDSRPIGWQIDFVCSVAANQLARDDYERADVEYLYAGPGVATSAREFRAYYGREMSLFSADEIDAFLQIYVEAVVRHLEKGHGAQPGKFSGYRIVDPAQGSFF